MPPAPRLLNFPSTVHPGGANTASVIPPVSTTQPASIALPRRAKSLAANASASPARLRVEIGPFVGERLAISTICLAGEELRSHARLVPRCHRFSSAGLSRLVRRLGGP